MTRVAAEHGVAMTTCLAGTGLTTDDLTDPSVEIEGKLELSVLRNVLRTLGDVPFGLLAGERYHLTTHGMWGFALLSSPTVRHVVDFSAKYFELSYSFNHFDFTIEPGQACLSYDGKHNPEDLQSHLIERDMAAAITFGRDLLGHKIPMRSVQLRTRRPRDPKAYELVFGTQVEFDARRNSIVFAADWLDRQPTLADDFGRRVSEAYRESILEGRDVGQGMTGDVSSFATAFKRWTGVSPRVYRHQSQPEKLVR